jgi:hypothetical protein
MKKQKRKSAKNNWAQKDWVIFKQELVDWLYANGVKVEEVEKGVSDKRVERYLEISKGVNQDVALGLEPATTHKEIEYIELYNDLTEEGLLENGFVTPKGYTETKFNRPELLLPGGTNYRELLLTLPNPNQDAYEQGLISKSERLSQEYHGTHYDEPNILAHVRFNEREVNGKRVLFLEEIQSDWHQEGRKKGYKRPDIEDKLSKLKGTRQVKRQV